MAAARNHRTPYQVLAAVVDRMEAGDTLDRGLGELLSALAGTVGAEYAAVWSPGERPTEVAAWPARDGRSWREGDHDVPVATGLGAPGRLVLAKAGGRPLTGEDALLLTQTACCVGLLMGTELLRGELSRCRERVAQLTAEQQETPARLGAVRALERRRLVTEVLAVTTPPLAGIRRDVRECADAVDRADSLSSAISSATKRLSGALDELIDRFRGVVRGVHSTVLRECGPVVALQELAADLPRPVRFIGSLPDHVPPEIVAVLYHVAVSALRAMAADAASDGVLVVLGRSDGRASVGVYGLVHSPTRLLAAVAPAAALLETLGGRLERVVDATDVSLAASLPDGLRPQVEGPPVRTRRMAAGPGARVGTLLGQVRGLISAAAAHYGDHAAGADMAAAAERLDGPVQVAVVGRAGDRILSLVGELLGRDQLAGMSFVGTAGDGPEPGVPAAAGVHRTVDVVVRAVGGSGARDALRRPNGLGRTEDGPYPLVVVRSAGPPGVRAAGERSGCGVPAGIVPVDVTLAVAAGSVRDTEYRALLALAASDSGTAEADLRQRLGRRGVRTAVALIRSGAAGDAGTLASELVRLSGLPDVAALLDVHVRSRSEVLRARSALRVAAAVLRHNPLPGSVLGPLIGEVERIVAGAHELAEMDTLAALRTGATALPAGLSAEAERLLGAAGLRSHVRLGLDPAAGAEVIRAAAAEQLVRWRRRAEYGFGDQAARTVCQTIVRTCEGLIAEAAVRSG